MTAEMRLDKDRAAAFVRDLRSRQSLPLGIVGGVIGALVGAVGWAVVTVVSGYHLGLIAIAIGFLVGYGVRYLGKGIDNSFRIAGATLALLGCVAGNFFTVCILLGRQHHISLLEVFSRLDAGTASAIVTDTFQVMDLLFYGIAAYEGYRFSTRRVTAAELASLSASGQPTDPAVVPPP